MVNNTIQDFNNEMKAYHTQSLYLNLINYQPLKINDTRHKAKVLSGYNKIMNLLNKLNK